MTEVDEINSKNATLHPMSLALHGGNPYFRLFKRSFFSFCYACEKLAVAHRKFHAVELAFTKGNFVTANLGQIDALHKRKAQKYIC
jgi:hypothetical protein